MDKETLINLIIVVGILLIAVTVLFGSLLLNQLLAGCAIAAGLVAMATKIAKEAEL